MTNDPSISAIDIVQTPPAVARPALEAEYAALIALVESFSRDDWSRPTDCTGWTVRDMVAHLAGSAECAVRKLAMLRHYGYAGWKSRKSPTEFVDYMCRSQIASRAGLSDDELVRDLTRWGTRAPAKLTAGWPGFLRRRTMPPSAGLPSGSTLSTFLDVIHLRDIWLHRIDLTRAVGREREITSAEGELVQQVIRDLAAEWSGPPVELTLTGPGGGRWRIGDGPPVAHVTEDAVAYLRLLSGRSDECRFVAESLRGEAGSADGDPAVVEALRAARVIF
ncbi:MAG: maleylpyruvate isomerase family mycothiol-dependent enzyme [Propionibacteriaceae bacterium]|nr:maleylpyruvate isomerase family mycothiol-dependent enzyme [Propionibacteriaceae bacterium]